MKIRDPAIASKLRGYQNMCGDESTYFQSPYYAGKGKEVNLLK